MSLLAELKRRNVFRVAMFYAVASWVLLQVGGLLFEALEVPPWGLKLLLGLLLLGFPLALVFSWIYELTPEGLKREHDIDPQRVDHRTYRRQAQRPDRGPAGRRDRAPHRGPVHRSHHPRAARCLRRDGSAVPPGASAAPSPGAAPDPVAASIAVLPFVNMSEDKANDYFSDGLTEELLNVLANVPGLRVIARTSSFSYKGKEIKIADVARDLNVDHVLEGSVRKSGNRVRITTQLIRSSDSSHLWSQTYDRTLDDIFAVQDEISSEVVDALKVRLLKPEAAVAEVGGTKIPAAYEAYLRGRQLRHEGEAEATLREALAAFDEAIRLDPDYARAYAGKADVLSTLASNAYMPLRDRFRTVAAGVEARAWSWRPTWPRDCWPWVPFRRSSTRTCVPLPSRPSAPCASARAATTCSSRTRVSNRASASTSARSRRPDKAVELDPIAPRRT